MSASQSRITTEDVRLAWSTNVHGDVHVGRAALFDAWLSEVEAAAYVAGGTDNPAAPPVSDTTAAGARELGRTLHHLNLEALDATGMHGAMDRDLDGDWAAVWERVWELAALGLTVTDETGAEK